MVTVCPAWRNATAEESPARPAPTTWTCMRSLRPGGGCVQACQTRICGLVAGGRRLLQPLPRLRRVTRHAYAFGVQDAQVEFSQCVALFGRRPQPAQGLGVVPLHPLAAPIQHSERILRDGVALLGC